jgi:hypothetical protein
VCIVPRLAQDLHRLVVIERTGAVRTVYLPAINGAKPSVPTLFDLAATGLDQQ